MHTAAVSDDEPDELLPVNSILPAIPLADTDGTPGEINIPDAHHIPPQVVTNNNSQNNGPSSTQSFWDTAQIAWEKGGTDRSVNLQNLGQIFPDEAAIKNTTEVDWDPLPNAILHMMSNSIYMSLAFLTTSALDRIQLNQNVKYHKIPFRHGAGKITIDETSFPLEECLTEMDFWQASKNWLILVETLTGPAITTGWHAHH